MLESGLQAEAKEQEQVQEQVQEQQQQQGAPAAQDSPAAAAEEEEVRQELLDFGISGRVVDELAGCPIEHVRGWIGYAATQERLKNPIGYVIKQLRARASPPPLPDDDDDPNSYGALLRRYGPYGLED